MSRLRSCLRAKRTPEVESVPTTDVSRQSRMAQEGWEERLGKSWEFGVRLTETLRSYWNATVPSRVNIGSQ